MKQHSLFKKYSVLITSTAMTAGFVITGCSGGSGSGGATSSSDAGISTVASASASPNTLLVTSTDQSPITPATATLQLIITNPTLVNYAYAQTIDCSTVYTANIPGLTGASIGQWKGGSAALTCTAAVSYAPTTPIEQPNVMVPVYYKLSKASTTSVASLNLSYGYIQFSFKNATNGGFSIHTSGTQTITGQITGGSPSGILSVSESGTASTAPGPCAFTQSGNAYTCTTSAAPASNTIYYKNFSISYNDALFQNETFGTSTTPYAVTYQVYNTTPIIDTNVLSVATPVLVGPYNVAQTPQLVLTSSANLSKQTIQIQNSLGQTQNITLGTCTYDSNTQNYSCIISLAGLQSFTMPNNSSDAQYNRLAIGSGTLPQYTVSYSSLSINGVTHSSNPVILSPTTITLIGFPMAAEMSLGGDQIIDFTNSSMLIDNPQYTPFQNGWIYPQNATTNAFALLSSLINNTNPAYTNVAAWGVNNNSQLALNTNTQQNNPAQTQASNVLGQPLLAASVAQGLGFGCIINALNQQVYCVGNNTLNQLGAGSALSHNLSAFDGNYPVTTAANAVQLAAGNDFACALYTSNSSASGFNASCWGNNAYSQLALDPQSTAQGQNPQIFNGSTVAPLQIAVGASHACALVQDTSSGSVVQKVQCWGDNTYGAIGLAPDPDNPYITTPNTIDFSAVVSGCTTTPKFVAAGNNNSCAVVDVTCGSNTYTNLVACWGSNAMGQLANVSLTDSFTPVLAQTSSTVPATAQTAIAELSNNINYLANIQPTTLVMGSGQAHNTNTCLLITDWYMNGLSTLVDCTTQNSATNVCVLDTNHKGYCWGFNGYAQNGFSGSYPTSAKPPQFKFIPTATGNACCTTQVNPILTKYLPSGLQLTALFTGYGTTCARLTNTTTSPNVNTLSCFGLDISSTTGVNQVDLSNTQVNIAIPSDDINNPSGWYNDGSNIGVYSSLGNFMTYDVGVVNPYGTQAHPL